MAYINGIRTTTYTVPTSDRYLTVLEGSAIFGSFNDAVRVLDGVDAELYIHGNLWGPAAGIALLDAGSASVFIGETGVVQGGDNGMFIRRDATEVVNNGQILGDAHGIYYTLGAGDVRLTNSGTIQSFGGQAVRVEGDGDAVNDRVIITNAGDIQTLSFSPDAANGHGLLVRDESLYLDNSGTITGPYAGMALVTGPSVANNLAEIINSGKISGSESGFFATDARSIDLVNSGEILSSVGSAISLRDEADGTNRLYDVTNSGLIQAGSTGVNVSNESLNLVNSGTIDAQGRAVDMADADTAAGRTRMDLYLLNSGTISSLATAVSNSFADDVEINNSGTIQAKDEAISVVGDLLSFSNFQLVNGGTLQSTDGRTVRVTAENVQIFNVGTVLAQEEAVDANSDVFQLLNAETGVISSRLGVEVNATEMNVINHGDIGATGGRGLSMRGSSAEVVNSGSISAGDAAISISLGSITLRNTGAINSLENFALRSAGVADIFNSGTMTAADDVIALVNFVDDAVYNHRIVNSGDMVSTGTFSSAVFVRSGNLTMVNTRDGVISGTTGVQLRSNFSTSIYTLTLNNAGEISGTGGTAVTSDDAAASDLLTNYSTGVVSGSVELGGGADTVVNLGVIAGDVVLAVDGSASEDADVFVNFGTLVGDVFMGAGADVVRVLGDVRGSVDLGAGNDVAIIADGVSVDGVSGGAGDDIYVLGEASTPVRIIEQANGGRDRLLSSVSVTLAEHVEELNFQGAEQGLLGVGNAQDNLMVGNDGGVELRGLAGDDTLLGRAGEDVLLGGLGADTLNGGAGDDALGGGAGNDLLVGGLGADVITGGAGRDVAAGGAGADRFVFDALSDGSTTLAQADVINDFASGEDVLDLAGLFGDLGADFIGAGAFSGSGGAEVRATTQGTGTLVHIDADGNGATDMLVFLSATASITDTDMLLG